MPIRHAKSILFNGVNVRRSTVTYKRRTAKRGKMETCRIIPESEPSISQNSLTKAKGVGRVSEYRKASTLTGVRRARGIWLKIPKGIEEKNEKYLANCLETLNS